MNDEIRESNHRRVPLMREQVKALRKAAEALVGAAPTNPAQIAVGDAMTANMLLCFALERRHLPAL